MSSLLEYKCPCCGGAISFDSKVQKLKCPYCDTEFDIDTLDAYESELKSDRADEMEWQEEEKDWEENEKDGLFTFVCNSCGGEIIGDETTASTRCPYCDNPVVLKGRFEGGFKPDFIIPFKLDKNDAKKKFAQHLKGKKLLPKVFKDETHIDEIKGLYVPFWLFNADVNARLRYRGTKMRVWSDSSYNYTETQYYSIVRGGSLSFANVPVDGSSKMPDDLMESLEPFNFSEAEEFKPAYLAGYLADRYDVEAEETKKRAGERIKKTTEDIFRDTINGGYSSIFPEGGNISLKDGKVKYVLYPVWIMNTTWHDKKYTFAMNGQTGKFVGNLPMDKSLYFKWFGIYAAMGFALAFALSLFMHFAF